MRPRSPVRLVSLLTILILFTACGPKDANLTPSMKVAKYGGDVMASIRQVQQTVADLEAQGTLPTKQAATVMQVTVRMGDAGIALSSALTVYDTLKDPGALVKSSAEINKLLSSLSTGITEALAAVAPGGSKNKIVEVFRKLAEAILSIQAALAPWLPSGEPIPLPQEVLCGAH